MVELPEEQMCEAVAILTPCTIISLFVLLQQVPSVVFIQPPLGTVGLTEEQAREQVAGDVDVYVSKFRPMKNTITGREEKTLIKIIVEAATDKVCTDLDLYSAIRLFCFLWSASEEHVLERGNKTPSSQGLATTGDIWQ